MPNRKNEETGMWTDMSGDADFMADKVADGIDVHIVGVVRPNETANASALSPGIAYTHALTRQLMERAADSQIVQEQLAHPETDVFTGKSFDELQGEAKQGVDLGSMFSVDEAALKSAFSFDASALSGAASDGMDLSGVDLVRAWILTFRALARTSTFGDIMAKAPAPDFSGIFDGLELTPEQMQQVGTLANQLFEGFLQSDQFRALSPDDLKDASKLAAAFSAYLENDAAAQQILAQLKALGGDALAERLQQAMTDYVQKQLAPYLQQAMDQVMKSISEQIAATVSVSAQGRRSRAHGPDGDADVVEFCQPGERHARGCECLCSCHPLQHGRRGPELAHDELCEGVEAHLRQQSDHAGLCGRGRPHLGQDFPA